jgi:hypothetical protein
MQVCTATETTFSACTDCAVPTCSLLFAAPLPAGSSACAFATDSKRTVTLRGFRTDLSVGSELTSELSHSPVEAP